MPVSQLIRLTSLFGIEENATRVALSRMVAAGELGTDGRGTYELGKELKERQRRQSESRAAVGAAFDGRWHLLVLDASSAPAATRVERRRLLVRARLAEQREGVWLRPANIPVVVPILAESNAVRMLATPEGDAAALAAGLFDLEGWSSAARELEVMMDETPLCDATDLARGFIVSAAVLRHLQADPLLPDALLPAGWPGGALRSAYDDFDHRYRAILAAFHRSSEVTGGRAATPER